MLISLNKNCNLCSIHGNERNTCITNEFKESPLMIILDTIPQDSYIDESVDLYGIYKRLDELLVEVLQYDPKKVYVTSLIKCPCTEFKKDYANNCLQYLDLEIERVNPKCILAIGSNVLSSLTAEKSIDSCRNKDLYYKGVPLVAAYSPAYLMRSSTTESKITTWAEDVKRATTIASLGKSITKTMEDFNKYVIISSIEEVDTLIEYVKETGICSFDIETTGLVFFKDYITTLSITFQHGSSYVIPIKHFQSIFSDYDIEKIVKKLNDGIFSNPDVIKYGWNVKFDMRFLHMIGIRFYGRINDGMVMHHLLDENVKHNLKDVGASLYEQTKGYNMNIKAYKSWSDIPLNELAPYNAVDTDLTLRCCTHLENKLLSDPALYRLYRNLSCPSTYTLFYMELDGMMVDKNLLMDYILKTEEEMKELEAKMSEVKKVRQFVAWKRDNIIAEEIADLQKSLAKSKRDHTKKLYEKKIEAIKTGQVNLYDGILYSSPKQVSELLYSRNGLGFNRLKDEDGNLTNSVDKKYISKLDDKSGFIKLYLEWKNIEKIRGTYLVGLKDILDPKGYIHPNYKQTGTVTHRLSCSDPNLQNIPRSSTRLGKMVKKIYVPPKGYVLLQADYSQAELRIAAFLSGDERMISAYANDLDIHTITAKAVLRIPDEEWDLLSDNEKSIKRSHAKAINFGFLYGMSADSFKEYALNMYGAVFSSAEAKAIRDNFFKVYRRLLAWHSKYKSLAYYHGYVETLFGAKRRLNDIKSKDSGYRSKAERDAVNSPVQGTGGQFTLMAMNILRWRLPKSVIMVNTVHDSIIFYVPEDIVLPIAKLIAETGANPLTMEYFEFNTEPVGMKVDIEIGPSWGDLKKYTDYLK